jgi:predicted hotdog family 3-hydroxylacyl-ACP dehydratase
MAESVLIEGGELINLVPHKGRMFLLSRVTSYDSEKRRLASEYDITEDCLFYDRELQGVPAWVGFEFMAQSISALSGLDGRGRGEPPKFGFILSVSGLEVKIPCFKKGSTAVIEVEEETMVDNVYSFRCRVSSEGKPALEARLTVMEADDPKAVIEGAFSGQLQTAENLRS